MERRDFLAGAAGGLVAQFLAGWPTDSRAALISALPIADTGISAVGRHYLAMRPDLGVAELAALAFGEDAATAPPSADRVRWLVAERRRDDFLHGRTVLVDGWVLAESEAATCALLAAVT